jgi:hypothetical protein
VADFALQGRPRLRKENSRGVVLRQHEGKMSLACDPLELSLGFTMGSPEFLGRFADVAIARAVCGEARESVSFKRMLGGTTSSTYLSTTVTKRLDSNISSGEIMGSSSGKWSP